MEPRLRYRSGEVWLVCDEELSQEKTSQPSGKGSQKSGALTVSGYVTGRLKLIDNDFKMRDTPCPLDIARAFSGPPIAFPSAITHSNRAFG